MLTSADWTRMAGDLEDVRDDNAVSIVIRRDSSTLAAQTVRVARTGSGGKRDSGQAQESKMRVVVMGLTTLDIRVEDRFTTGGYVYRVTAVRPNKRAGVMVEAEVVE